MTSNKPSGGLPNRRRQAEYLWREDAQTMLRSWAKPIQDVARDNVVVDTLEGELTLMLPTNPDFEPPNVRDYDRGVRPGSPERYRAEPAIAVRTLVELLERETLQSWTCREIARRQRPPSKGRKKPAVNGRIALAQALIDTGVPFTASKSKKYTQKEADEKAMLRAVERWAKTGGEHHLNVNAANLRRIELLRGVLMHDRVSIAAAADRHAKQIVTEGRFVRGALRETRIVLSVWGLWKYSKTRWKGRIHTDPTPDDEELARGVVAGHGAKFIEEIEKIGAERSKGAAPSLERLYGLDVEVQI